MRTSASVLTLGLLTSLTALASIPNVAADLPRLSRSSTWTPLSSFKLQFNTFHPQGMVKVGDVYYLSSEVFRYRDHLGGVVIDPANHALHLVS